MVHLTADVLCRVFPSPQCLWLPLSNTIHLEAGVKAQDEGVAKFAGLSNHVTCVTFYNINDVNPPGHFEYDKAPLWTKNGKKLITAERYEIFLGFYYSNYEFIYPGVFIWISIIIEIKPCYSTSPMKV